MQARQLIRHSCIALMALAVAACGQQDAIVPVDDPQIHFTLPDGFSATIFAREIDQIRLAAAAPDGRVFVQRLGASREPGVEGPLAPTSTIVALRDEDGDGVADAREAFGDIPGTSLQVWRNPQGALFLYAAGENDIVRWKLNEDGVELAPRSEPEVIATGFPRQPEHQWKALAISDAGDLYVMVGAPSNACMERRRKKGSPGLDPCPQLKRAAGVWRFDAETPGQQQADAEHFARGLRNAFAFTWSERDSALYAVQHGRDVLSRFFPEIYDDAANAELPAEEYFQITRGDDLGWPYSYYDQLRGERMVMPEYGGDGETVSDIGEKPLIGFPGHTAPSGVHIYEGEMLPERYRGGAFVVLKGGWNRAPLPQAGFKVVFVPRLSDGTLSTDYEVFADGFAGPEPVYSQMDAPSLPMGITEGPDGALYLGDQMQEVMYRISYEGAGQ